MGRTPAGAIVRTAVMVAGSEARSATYSSLGRLRLRVFVVRMTLRGNATRVSLETGD
jgi:hypothetical protein